MWRMPEPTSTSWQLANRITGGTLEALMRKYRRSGCSWPAALNLIVADFPDLSLVSPETMRRWGVELEIPAPETEPAEVAS